MDGCGLCRLFKEYPHPDDKQRADLSKRLGLEPRQVKFWFQNRRTQMKVSSHRTLPPICSKQRAPPIHAVLHRTAVSLHGGVLLLAKTQLERHENALLKQENDKLRAESLSVREAMRNPVCGNCGGPAMLGELSLEEHHLRVENARLRDELTRVCALTAKFIGKPISLMALPQMHQLHPVPGSSLEIAAAAGLGSVPPSTTPVATISELAAGSVSSPLGTVITPLATGPLSMVGIDKSIILELAMNAMDELVKMAQMNEPLWIPSVSSPGSPVKETLNFKEYLRAFSPCIELKPPGFVSEASRESGIVLVDSSAALVEAFMDEVLLVQLCPFIYFPLPVCFNLYDCLNG
jgi:homeobox-leucine zipper protein